MFLTAIVLVNALAVPLFGGRLTALAEVRARWAWLLLAALGLQVASLNVPGIPEGLRPLLQLASYPLAGLFVVVNRRLPGMPLIGLGALLNVIAMSANGGVMPASPSALRTAGLPLHHDSYINSSVVDDARLAFLGDVFAIPESLPLHNVFSVGDVLIGLGAVVALHGLCGSRLPSRRPRGRHERPRHYQGRHLNSPRHAGAAHHWTLPGHSGARPPQRGPANGPRSLPRRDPAEGPDGGVGGRRGPGNPKGVPR